LEVFSIKNMEVVELMSLLAEEEVDLLGMIILIVRSDRDILFQG